MEREENRRLSGMLKTDMEYLNRVLDVEKNMRSEERRVGKECRL